MNYYKNKYKLSRKDFEFSEEWGEGTLTIPLFESMKEEEQEYVIDILINEISPMMGKS